MSARGERPPAPYLDFANWKHDRPADGVLRLWLDTGLPGNAITHQNHREFSTIWNAVAADEEARSVVVRGVDGTLCAGGDMSFLPPMLDDAARRSQVLDDIVALVQNILRCPKPIITAIEGVCSGGGLAMALMADIPIAATSAFIIDAHVMAGVACGDHAAFAWPLLMGMARAKYHLLSATPLTGEQADRNGLVALSVGDDELHDRSLALAVQIASLDPEAVSLTKKSIGGWYQLGMPIFEQSAAYEASGFAGNGARNAVAAWEAGHR